VSGGRGPLLAGGLIAALALGGAAALASWRRAASDGASVTVAPRRVMVARARRGAAERTVDLPGEARPLSSITVFAQTSGYLGAVLVDRGDRVEQNQVLAEIRAPEVERRQRGARADEAFKRARARRGATLTRIGALPSTQVDADEASAAAASAASATLGSQRAFAVLRAPFAGTVTARFADPGALIQNAANGRSGALPVVVIARTDRLRIHAYLDHRNARAVRPGDQAEMIVPGSGLRRVGQVARISGALDSRSRTVLLEIPLDNADGGILPGSYLRVRLTLKAEPLVEVPGGALILRGTKAFVAVVNEDNRISLRPVSVGDFQGTIVGLQSGLSEGEPVALDLGRSAVEGDLIAPITAAPSPVPGTPP
jgi:membrane fusion protein (multidrug efflux system)